MVNGLHVAGVRNSETGESTQRGFELELPLPLFDLGDAARAGGEARYLAAFNRTLGLASNASSQVRVAYEGYRSAYDLARHYRNEVVPLRQNITEESVLQYNGMLIGVFELLAAARAQSASVVQAIEAERDFWRAERAACPASFCAGALGEGTLPTPVGSSSSKSLRRGPLRGASAPWIVRTARNAKGIWWFLPKRWAAMWRPAWLSETSSTANVAQLPEILSGTAWFAGLWPLRRVVGLVSFVHPGPSALVVVRAAELGRTPSFRSRVNE